ALFLMAITAGNGANAGALSPFAPTGIIVSGLMARNGLPGLEWWTYGYNLLAHATVAFCGYALFGGLKLFKDHRVVSAADPGAVANDPAEGPFERRHWLTLAVIVALIVSVLVARVNVGMGALAGALIVGLGRAATHTEAIRGMPWRVIIMVCGGTVLISFVERVQGIDLLVSLMVRIASPHPVTAVVAFITGMVSV